ncbi:MAG: hypothetical protein AB1696_27585 [Planctomycetota bacterium]
MPKMILLVLVSTFLALPLAALAQKRQFERLTGWGGGKAEEICPRAADIGFNEIIVWNRDPDYLRHFVEVGSQYGIEAYASVHLNDIRAWKKRYPDAPPPLQAMSKEENEALERLKADKRPGKGQYQVGGEPLDGRLEVLLVEMLCPHRPEVVSFLKEEIKAALAVEGLKGIAFDFFGYQNYRCCRCEHSMKLFDAYHKKHPDLPREGALDRFSLDTLVAFNNELAYYARSVRPGVKVATHIYPVFLSEPLYGNRLNVDYCGQTAAWYFDPFWGVDKIRQYSHIIAADAKKRYPNAEGVALIGIHTDPEKNGPVKTPDRIASELQAILDGGCARVQVCSMNSVLKDEAIAAVFKRFFGPR